MGIIDRLLDTRKLQIWITDLGYWGPVMLIALMAVAIVINPIPSAPIALAAGAAYGHTMGTLYVVIGAGIGAVTAFWIARLLGYQLLRQYLGDRVQLGWLGSQNALTWMVLVSRFIPFVSFDLVSYGAGLTPIKPWRFTLATLIGLIPASFLLAHFGGELAAAELNKLMLLILALGLLTLIPIIFYSVVKGTLREQSKPD